MKFNLCSVLIAGISLLPSSVYAAGPFELPPLPYEYSALEPHIGQQTLEIHHDKHHAKYVNTMNSIIAGGAEFEGMSLAEIVKASYGKDQGLFNNAAQSWNHEFYWKCMTPDYKSPPKSLVKAIKESFGSVKNFKEKFSKAGNTAFGSGWAWLCYDSSTKNLIVTNTIGAGNPMAVKDKSLIPLLTMDVWEHAYYLDYQNMRPTYTEVFLEKLVDWNFVAENLKTAVSEEKTEL